MSKLPGNLQAATEHGGAQQLLCMAGALPQNSELIEINVVE